MELIDKYWIPVFKILEKICLVTLAHSKYTKPQKENKTDRKNAKWICDLFMCDMIKPRFIPYPEIRQLRDLMRYRSKLTNTVTGEKNRAQNCLTVSNLKLADVFSDICRKSARSITNYILGHLGETFDVAPFVDKRYKTPIEEIQATVDRAISQELLVQIANVLIKSKKHPEFKERHHRIKSHRGHRKAIIALCKMFLTASWNILSKLEPYNPDVFLEHRPVNQSKVLTKTQALELLQKKELHHFR